MPQQKRRTDENPPVAFRPSALNRQRLDRLIQKRGESQSAVINAAIELLYRLDCEAKIVMTMADKLTDYGQNDPGENQMQPIFYDGMIDNFSSCPEANNIRYKCYIYTLNDKTGVRYIGQTNGPSMRLSGHMCNARNGRDKTKRGLWIKSLVDNQQEPSMMIIEMCPTYQSNERERYWINYYRNQGADLVNSQRWDKS